MNTLKRFCLYGTLFVIVIGTLSHFIYEWSGESPLAALFCPVNESTWEHMKLLFFPACLFCFYMIIRLKSQFPTIITASALGIIVGTFSIPFIFYSYTKILGQNYLILDILTFVISAIICFLCIYISCSFFNFSAPFLSVVVILLLAFCFFVFTFYPPELLWFIDPVLNA